MAKLGYTWYPKDWGNSESVFEMTLSERGLYRELIDLAMLNNNETEIKYDVWSRKYAISIDELKLILEKLVKLNVLKINGTNLFIPSCEPRLNLSRGGKASKPNETSLKNLSKPTSKPISKPISEQREREREIEINKPIIYSDEFNAYLTFAKSTTPKLLKMKSPLQQKEFEKLKLEFGKEAMRLIFLSMENKKDLLKKYDSVYLTALSWLKNNNTESKPKKETTPISFGPKKQINGQS